MFDKKEKEHFSCKRVLGQTICKVNSAIVVPHNQIPITIYKSRQCPYCDNEINKFKKELKKTKGLVSYEIVNVEDQQSFNINLLSGFPVVDFGNGVVKKGNISKLSSRDIFDKVIESTRRGELLDSFMD